MEFSVERKASIKKRELKKLKEDMIKKEALHIYDSIEHSRFLELYSVYGTNLSESEFGDIFLDMSKNDYYDLKKRGSCKILKKEVVDDYDIECMKVKLIKELGLKQLDEKRYDELVEIYNKAQSKLSLVHFAEKILDVAQQTVSRTSIVKTRKTTILSKTNSDYFNLQKCDEVLKSTLKEIEKRKMEISDLKDIIAKDRNLHMSDEINKNDFEEIYQIYGEGFTKEEFASSILGVGSTKIKSLLNDKTKDVKIWKEEIPTLDYLLRIREETILEEKLHINEKINYERFKEIYKRHSGILNEVDFALEVLDIERARYNELKKGKSESGVISSIEAPEEFYVQTKQKIKNNENVYKGKFVTYEEFQMLHEKYGFIINDLEFGEKVLEMDQDAIMSLRSGRNKIAMILKNKGNEKNSEEIKKLRQLVIRENKLHIKDSIRGSKFKILYEKYGFGMSPKDFAFEILDIKDNNLNLILRDENRGTQILTNEKVSSEEIKSLRKRLFRIGEHCKGDRIDYKEFLRLYNLYGGILSEKQFANKILFISSDKLVDIRNDLEGRAEIFCRAKFSDAYIANLKAKVVKENLLFYNQSVTLAFLNKLYKSAHTIMSKRVFAKEILEINNWSLCRLENKEIGSSFILTTSGTEQNKVKFLERQDKKIKQMLEAGYGYDEIEENINLSKEELNKKIENLYETELDEKSVTCKYIYNKAKNGQAIDERRVKTSNIEEDKIISIIARVNKEKELQEIKKQCDHIMYEVDDTEKNRKILKRYIRLCREFYWENPKEMPEEILDSIQNCIEFLDIDFENSLFFVRVCIDNMEYKRANEIVTFNMQDENLSISDKRKLQEMRTMIRDASKKKDTVMKKRRIIPMESRQNRIFEGEYAV